MKTFIACLGTETNSFSPMPTGRATFEEACFFRGDATQHTASTFTLPLHVWRQKTEERQGEAVESLATFAQPAGITIRSVYEGYRDEILADLKAALPVDIVLLSMQGAMTAEGYDDCEGDLLARVREVVGLAVIVGAELDLHCSITPRMVEKADALVLFKEYPHIDVGERAAELFDICAAAAAGEVRPVTEVRDLKIINKWRTPKEPMKTVVAEMQAAEQEPGVLSVSFAHGFPWQDVACTSSKMLVISDGDRAQAGSVAERFVDRLWGLREDLVEPMLSIEAALDAVEAGPGPLVLADVADNAGGGAPSDSTFVLAAALARGMSGLLTGYYWDPVAVRFCEEAGEGAKMRLRVGGKCGPESGDPVDLKATVRRIVTDGTQSFGEATMPMGTVVWLTEEGGIDLILTSKRTQVFHPNGMTQLGIDPGAYKGIVVKSSQHFYAGFEPVAASIQYISGAGSIPADFASIPYENFTDDYWPKVENPHG